MSARYRRRPLRVPPPADDALSHGMALAAVPVTFGVLGWLLDRGIGTGPAFLLLFAFFGVAASFTSAYYRYSARIARESEGKPWARTRCSGALATERNGAVLGRAGRRSGATRHDEPGVRSEVDHARGTT